MTDGTSTDAQARLVLADIRKYGCHVLHVLADEDFAPFSYSIGLNRSLKSPDLAIIGLRKDLAHAAIQRYRDALIAGRRFSHGMRVQDMLDSSEGELREVHPSHFPQWFGWNLALYGSTGFRMQQLVYPGTDGSWPWEPQSGKWFKRWQPVLDKPASDS